MTYLQTTLTIIHCPNFRTTCLVVGDDTPERCCEFYMDNHVPFVCLNNQPTVKSSRQFNVLINEKSINMLTHSHAKGFKILQINTHKHTHMHRIEFIFCAMGSTICSILSGTFACKPLLISVCL